MLLEPKLQNFSANEVQELLACSVALVITYLWVSQRPVEDLLGLALWVDQDPSRGFLLRHLHQVKPGARTESVLLQRLLNFGPLVPTLPHRASSPVFCGTCFRVILGNSSPRSKEKSRVQHSKRQCIWTEDPL